MTDEEKAEKYAKEISRCRECINYNYCHKIENEYHPKCKMWEWLFVGLKKGLAEGRKEGILKDCLKVTCPNCKPSVDNYCVDCEYANFIIDKEELEKENARLSKMLEMACDILGDFIGYDSYSVMSDWGITLEDRSTIRSVLDKRIEEA